MTRFPHRGDVEEIANVEAIDGIDGLCIVVGDFIWFRTLPGCEATSRRWKVAS